MLSYRLRCSCGFESNSAPYLQEIEMAGYCLPVFVPGDERLRFVQVVQGADESEEDFDNRLSATLKQMVVTQFGPKAVPLEGLGGHQKLPCPRCEQVTAKFEFAGF